MEVNKVRFGNFIKSKRLADSREITLKDMAAVLGLSVTMVSDVENNRRKPYDAERLKVLCDYLELSPEDRSRVYDLAAVENDRIPADIEHVMMYSDLGDMARAALRMSNDGFADEEDWRAFIRKLEAKKKGGI